MVYDKDFINKYNGVLNKIRDLLKKQLNSELVYKDIDKYIKTKVNLHNTLFLNKSPSKSECYAWSSVS